jgi:hypothetical protein
MFFQHRPLALLALASLLFGNVAGWVHVGCHQHEQGIQCCHDLSLGHSHCCDHQTDDSGQDCCHSDDSLMPPMESLASLVVSVSSQHGEQWPNELAANEQNPGEPAPCEHDSQRCSICQSFFASRTAIVLPNVSVVFQPADFSRELIAETVPWVGSVDLSGLSVRGPPQA